MKPILKTLALALILILPSCKKEERDPQPDYVSITREGILGSPDITAAEWKDLDNWGYWSQLVNYGDFSEEPLEWNFYSDNRVSVIIQNNFVPVPGVKVEFYQGLPNQPNQTLLWSSVTDINGQAELWIDITRDNNPRNLLEYSIYANGQLVSGQIFHHSANINIYNYTGLTNYTETVDLAFVVDATISMKEEIDFLKADLGNIIQKLETENTQLEINTASVFYRDEGDEYVTKASDFTNNYQTTIDFIDQQSANGGGDYPEALHTALDVMVNDLQWTATAKTKIAFLILDAPPHNNPEVITQLQNTIKKASEMGIKIIPIVASDGKGETEFLMRNFANFTNGTYVFLTDNSGEGTRPEKETIGIFQVELLKDILVRLVEENSL